MLNLKSYCSWLIGCLFIVISGCNEGNSEIKFDRIEVITLPDQMTYFDVSILDSVNLDSLRLQEQCFEYATSTARGSGARISYYFFSGLRFSGQLTLADAKKLWKHPNRYIRSLAYYQIFKLDRGLAAEYFIESNSDTERNPKDYDYVRLQTVLAEHINHLTRIRQSCQFNDILQRRIVENTDGISFDKDCYIKLSTTTHKD